jgi:hypothetical protein
LDALKTRLAELTDETRLEPLVQQINELVHKLNTLGTNAISLAVSGVDLETERQRLRERSAGRRN